MQGDLMYTLDSKRHTVTEGEYQSAPEFGLEIQLL